MSSLSAIQIENCLPKLQEMAEARRRLIIQYQVKIDRNPPPKQTKPLIKLNIDKQQFRKFPVKFFWTTEGKSARYYQYEFPKPCLLCESYAKIEVVDKYSTVQLCELHGLQVALKLKLKVTELPHSITGSKTIISGRSIANMIAILEKLRDQRFADKQEQEEEDEQ